MVKRAGLADRVTVLMEDYRDLTGSYDKLVSIEMIEAVGWRHYGAFFRKCSQLLTPHGAMLLQAITIDDRAYEVEKAAKSFINTRIFPGGCLPSLEVIMRNVARRTDMQAVHLEDITAPLRRDAATLAPPVPRLLAGARPARLRRALSPAVDAVSGLLRGGVRRAPDLRPAAAAHQAAVARGRPAGRAIGRAALGLARVIAELLRDLGYALRSPRWDESDLAAMDGKVVLVTGATSGLGEAAATGFARLGASVWLVARSRERGEDARARIAEQTGSDDVHVGICDLSDLRSVRRFAEQCEAGPGRVDVLVNNAGVLTEERSLSRDGIELTLATNVVGPFLLTKLLSPLLRRSAPARVINVSSGGMYTQGLHVDDLQSAHGKFRGTVAYARSQAHRRWC